MRYPVTIAALLIAACVGAAGAQRARQEEQPVVEMALPLKFPAVGNIESVVQWRFGRLEDVGSSAGGNVALRIRMADRTVTVTGPGPQIAELAVRSGWVRGPAGRIMGTAEYVERMIAFDYDPEFRLIAMASLEPLDRNRSRLRRALGGA